MKPVTEDKEIISEIPIRMLFHPKEVKVLDCWDIGLDEPTVTRIETLNIRSSTHSLEILRISEDIKIYKAGKVISEHRSLRTVLNQMFGLQLSDQELRKTLIDAYKKYGSSIWLRACPYSLSIHGLLGFNGQPKNDYLLIQSGAETRSKPNGMFIVKHKLLNEYFKSVGSNKRFTKTYTRHKII